MHIHFKEDQSLEELFWPHIRAQLLPRLENIDPHHAVFAIRRALESEYGAVAAVLAAAVAAADPAASAAPADLSSRRVRLQWLLYRLLDALVLSIVVQIAAVLIFILTTKGFALDTAYGVGLMLSIAVIGLYLLAVGIYRRRAW